MQSKVCSKCKEAKSLDSFSKNKTAPDGHHGYCKPCHQAYRKSREQNPEIKAAYRKTALAWEGENRDAARQKCKRWKKKNPDKLRSLVMKRRAAKLNRTVSWSDDQAIEEFYECARGLTEKTGILFHVDHIIPLQGELVSGLHIEGNLQVIMAHENLGKSNKFDPMAFDA